MKYINPNSNRGLVNKFADFILNQINKDDNYKTIIEVVNCTQFWVIKGKTNSKNPLNIGTVKDTFINDNKELLTILELENFNVIDLIEYDVEIKSNNDFWFSFYNTKRPFYSQNQLDLIDYFSPVKFNSLNYTNQLELELEPTETLTELLPFYYRTSQVINSEFPHGFSLDTGRIHLYYSEYVALNIFKSISANEIKIKITDKTNINEDLDIEIKTDSIYDDKTIQSMVLDTFDFNLNDFKYVLNNYNVTNDLTNPLDEKPWLFKDKTNNCIIF